MGNLATEETTLELAPMPPSVRPPPREPEPVPTPPTDPPAAGAAVAKKPGKVEIALLTDAELADALGMGYAGLFEAVGALLVDGEVELPERKAAARGRALAVLFRKVGWADAEIVLLSTLFVGVAGDVAYVVRLKRQEAAAPKKKPAPAPAPVADEAVEPPAPTLTIDAVPPRDAPAPKGAKKR